ncbi:MAG: dCTP deaminase [Synechococcaceae cyanobacterium]|nr:dCTP deaminase [Synechococcaceae cyanobacterium]
MTVLVDHQIEHLCLTVQMVTPYNPALLNPASLDVRLGDTLLIERAGDPALVPYPLRHHSEADPYRWQPGQFCLAPTMETFNMPDTVAGEFRLKSSRAREGMDQALAVWLDPGWHGSVLTLELRNNRQLHWLPLWPGMKIGQIVFHPCEAPRRSYAVTGRYCNDKTVQESKG